MERHSIITVDITADMILEAKADVQMLKEKIGRGTRAAYENRDLIGSLAHQIVEEKFEDCGLDYLSTRKVKMAKGDEYDILYERDRIDVKGTHGTLDDKWFYRQQFLVFAQQIAGEKIDKITHFIFVLIEPNLSRGHIFGVISTGEFERNCYPVKLQYDNMAIRATSLKPFLSYVYRTG